MTPRFIYLLQSPGKSAKKSLFWPFWQQVIFLQMESIWFQFPLHSARLRIIFCSFFQKCIPLNSFYFSTLAEWCFATFPFSHNSNPVHRMNGVDSPFTWVFSNLELLFLALKSKNQHVCHPNKHIAAQHIYFVWNVSIEVNISIWEKMIGAGTSSL